MYIWFLGAGFLLTVVALLRLKGLPEQKPDTFVKVVGGLGVVMVVGVFGWFMFEGSTGMTPSPDQPSTQIQDAVEGALGSSNRDTTRVADARLFGKEVHVTWSINDNLSEGLIKDSARKDASDILEAVSSVDVAYESVSLEGTFALVDQLGNESEETVVEATYSHSLVEQINFENFNFKNVFDIADTAYIHPTFQY